MFYRKMSESLSIWCGKEPHTPNTSMMQQHYTDVTMTMMASQITSLTVVYSTVYSDADHRKHQSSVSLAFVWGNSPGPVNSPHKGPVTRKMFPFDDVRWCQVPTDVACGVFRYHQPILFRYQWTRNLKFQFIHMVLKLNEMCLFMW